MQIIKQLELIERVDQLIRLNATGAPNQFAYRLGISKTKLYRILRIMKDMNAPLKYDDGLRSFIYEQDVRFSFGFQVNVSENKCITESRKRNRKRKDLPMLIIKNVEKMAC